MNGGLTDEELEISELLIDSYNKFLKLTRTHPNEKSKFADNIHKLQYILGMRVLRRNYPNYWINYENE